MIELEICLASDGMGDLANQAKAVVDGGAQRIELCASMADDGLTPSLADIECVSLVTTDYVELLVMLRPVSGDFIYNEQQINEMCDAIPLVAGAGANGVVVGVLNQDNSVNLNALQQLVQKAHSNQLSVTFHRAFDAIEDKHKAQSLLMSSGISRVLSAGTNWSSGLGAEQGITSLQQFLQQSNGKTELVVGGGVNLSNIQALKQQLSKANGLLSFHTHSAVLTNGLVDIKKVAKMVEILAP